MGMPKVDEFRNLSSVGDALSGVLDSPEALAKMSLGRRASRAWFKVNGDIERTHTTGIYVRKPRRAGGLPTLGVYVDSAARAVDFRANREVYLARLAMAGLEFADIKFEKTHRPVGERRADKPATGAAGADGAPEALLPALTAEQEAYVRDSVAKLPEKVRASAYKAMSASLRRQMYNSSRNDN